MTFDASFRRPAAPPGVGAMQHRMRLQCQALGRQVSLGHFVFNLLNNLFCIFPWL